MGEWLIYTLLLTKFKHTWPLDPTKKAIKPLGQFWQQQKNTDPLDIAGMHRKPGTQCLQQNEMHLQVFRFLNTW